MSQMIEVKTAELIGPALDWAVAKAECAPVQLPASDVVWHKYSGAYSPSTDWAQGGSLADKYKPDLQTTAQGEFAAYLNNDTASPDPLIFESGPTYLVALCRAIVAAKLGDVVSAPAELVGGGV